MLAVLHALHTWLPHFAGCRLMVYGDNTGVVQGLKHSSIEGPAMDPLRDGKFPSRCTIERSERQID